MDPVVYKTPTRKLETKLYTMKTDRQAYLHRKSEHPESLKRNSPFAQALHLRRTCIRKRILIKLQCKRLTGW